jgi:hypothetical protein
MRHSARHPHAQSDGRGATTLGQPSGRRRFTHAATPGFGPFLVRIGQQRQEASTTDVTQEIAGARMCAQQIGHDPQDHVGRAVTALFGELLKVVDLDERTRERSNSSWKSRRFNSPVIESRRIVLSSWRRASSTRLPAKTCAKSSVVETGLGRK